MIELRIVPKRLMKTQGGVAVQDNMRRTPPFRSIVGLTGPDTAGIYGKLEESETHGLCDVTFECDRAFRTRDFTNKRKHMQQHDGTHNIDKGWTADGRGLGENNLAMWT